MKRTIIVAMALFGLLFASVAQAQTAAPLLQNSSITINNEGNVLSDNDIATIRTHAAKLPTPLLVYITNQFRGAKIDFSRKVAQLVTANNVVIGISTYKDSNENDRYRLIGAGPQSGVSADLLNGAQNEADRFLRATSGPQYAPAIAAAIDYIVNQLGPTSNNVPPTAVAGNNSTDPTSTDPTSKGSGFWANIGAILLLLFGLWLVFLFVRWLWRLSHPLAAGQQRPGGAASGGSNGGGGGGYYDSGPVFYPIWLGGGHYGGDSGGPVVGGGNVAPPTPDAGGGSFASAFGGGSSGSGGGSGVSDAGGGKFESSFGPSSGGSNSSASSGAGGGAFESVVGATGATIGGQAAGAVAGAAINILGGILGAVFSAGSSGSGPDF